MTPSTLRRSVRWSLLGLVVALPLDVTTLRVTPLEPTGLPIKGARLERSASRTPTRASRCAPPSLKVVATGVGEWTLRHLPEGELRVGIGDVQWIAVEVREGVESLVDLR